jgi:cell division protein FtsW
MGERSLHFLVISVVALLGLGIVMLLSTSVYVAEGSDVYHDVHRQIVWIMLGITACGVCAAIDYRFWLRFRWAIFGVACVLLALCFLPILGEERNGSFRWVSLRDFGIDFIRLQPSELAKLAVVFVLAGWLAKNVERVKEIGHGFAFPLAIALVPVALIAIETDMGTSVLITATAITLLFIAGCRWWLVALTAVAGLAVLAVAVKYDAERMDRVLAFLDLEGTRTGDGLQQWRALLAMSEGGWFGMGLGEGREKLMYLPYAHTDFIFPMIGEELGAVATLAVIAAFMTLLFAGISIARSAPDDFGRLLGMGIVLLIALQAIMNIGVTTAVLPNKGLPLPFISYGGSNLLFSLAGIGILLNIYRQGHTAEDDGMGALFGRCRALGRV